jgi:hypothetical protein
VRLNRVDLLQGLLSSGLFNGPVSGPLSTIVRASVGGPERKRRLRKGGMRGFLDARDGPFLPEPGGGPKSRSKPTPEATRSDQADSIGVAVTDYQQAVDFYRGGLRGGLRGR